MKDQLVAYCSSNWPSVKLYLLFQRQCSRANFKWVALVIQYLTASGLEINKRTSISKRGRTKPGFILPASQASRICITAAKHRGQTALRLMKQKGLFSQLVNGNQLWNCDRAVCVSGPDPGKTFFYLIFYFVLWPFPSSQITEGSSSAFRSGSHSMWVQLPALWTEVQNKIIIMIQY